MESTFDYPNLKKAVKLLDESNYTEGQLIAYDNYLASVMSWNTTMMHQFDEGKAEGRVEGKAEGIEEGKAQEREKFLAIIYDIKAGISVEEIAQKYQVEVELIERLK